MAVKRALVFKAGTVGLVCAATEVAIERGSEDRPGTIRPIGECSQLATVEVQRTAFCDAHGDQVARSSLNVVKEIKRGGQ